MKLAAALAFLALTVATPAVAAAPTATASDLHMSTKKGGQPIVTTFKADETPVYCVGKLHGPQGTHLQATWFAVVGKQRKPIYGKRWVSQKPNEAFYFMLDAKGKAKPAGSYEVDVAVEGKQAGKQTFDIK